MGNMNIFLHLLAFPTCFLCQSTHGLGGCALRLFFTYQVLPPPVTLAALLSLVVSQENWFPLPSHPTPLVSRQSSKGFCFCWLCLLGVSLS